MTGRENKLQIASLLNATVQLPSILKGVITSLYSNPLKCLRPL
jgi:hypothetical protein